MPRNARWVSPPFFQEKSLRTTCPEDGVDLSVTVKDDPTHSPVFLHASLLSLPVDLASILTQKDLIKKRK